MNKRLSSFLTSFLAILLILSVSSSSCTSSHNDETDEYFFEGKPVSLSSMGGALDGNYLYFIQGCTYDVPISGKAEVAKQAAQKMVKLNLETLEVTCACIDPLCSHTHGSDCPMFFESDDTVSNIGVVGHWLYYLYSEFVRSSNPREEESYNKPAVYLGYNLDTGETREFFSRNNVLDDTTLFFADAPLRCGNLLYTVICEFTEDAKTPDDVEYYLASYDFEHDKTEKLFQVDDTANLNAITNKRFYFCVADGVNGDTAPSYSVDREGKNRIDNCPFNRLGVSFCGSRAYKSCDYIYDEKGNVIGNTDHCSMFDLRTGKWSEVPDGGGWGVSPLGDSIYYIAYDNMSEYASLNQADFKLKHPEMTESQLRDEYQKYKFSYVIDGSIHLMRADPDGKNPETVASFPSSKMIISFAGGHYLGVIFEEYDREAFDKGGEIKHTRTLNFALLDVRTGELIEIPQSRN